MAASYFLRPASATLAEREFPCYPKVDMAPLALLLALLLRPAPARAIEALPQARDAAAVPVAGDDASRRESAAAPFDGNPASQTSVVGRDSTGAPVLAKTAPRDRAARPEPPAAPEKEGGRSRLSAGLMLAGAGLLGGLQGWFSAGLLGAAAGAGLGLAAAWLFHKKDYGGAFGVTAGAIVGTAIAGPVGGLVGAVVGGLLGHFLGKLFL